MEDQREALRKIITTLAMKNEETQTFIYSLKQMLLNVEANSAKVQEDLEAEFQSLTSVLEELKESMLMKIKQDRASRTYELQNQLAACTRALESSEELLETANQTLQASDSEDFSQAAKEIKDGYTWMVVEGIRQTEHTLTGLKFDMKYMNIRVKACNKAVAGEFSEPVTLETPAFMFRLDGSTSHQNLRVEDLSAEWDAMGGKVQDIKAREKEGKGRTASPVNSPARGTPSPKRMSSGRGGRDRFTAESYTVLGDTLIDGGEHYWEVRFEPDLLSFYNARTKQLLHTFKAKFTQPLLPAFTVWCGSFQVTTGLQVPSAVRCLQKRGSATSSSNTSLT